MRRRLLRSALALGALVLLGVTALTVRTPARAERWLAEYDSAKHYLVTAGANFDWIVAEQTMDLPALDSAMRQRIATSWTSLGAAWTVRGFVNQFDDGHTRARIRPAIWWRGVTAADKATMSRGSSTTGIVASLETRMTGAEACGMAGLHIDAHPDGWSLPFPDAAGAELVPDPEFPAVIMPLGGGRTAGILRVASFGHEDFGPSCARAWEAYRVDLPEPCTGDCVTGLEARVMRAIAERAAQLARDLERRGTDVVVVDITGNGGGSELADAMARALTAMPLHLAAGGFIKHPLHADYLQEMRNALASDTAVATPSQRVLIDKARQRLDSLIVNARQTCDRDVVWSGEEAACSNVVATPPLASYVAPGTLDGLENGWIIWPASWHGTTEGIYTGPLLILQDRFSASASEEFAARLRDNNAATIIGARSYGAGCGHSNGGTSLELRALGLLVRAPDCQRLRMDGTNETAGIMPDAEAGWTAEDSGADSVRKATDAIDIAVRNAP